MAAAEDPAYGEDWMRCAIAAMSQQRLHIFRGLQSKQFNFGSDCTGSDSAFTAAKIWGKAAQTFQCNKMASEDPKQKGPQLFQLLNHAPERLYLDVLSRSHSGYCLIAKGPVPVPSGLDIYTAGTMCTDFSSLNTKKPKTQLHLRACVILLN